MAEEAHILAIWALGGSIGSGSSLLLPLFLIMTITAATTWTLTFGRGPLERLIAWICARAVAP
ncbi:hypothetical protein [Nocardia mexicana]|uniref:Uncharacterized protein n=1 Tax=Nocardia mexicana TaxID=279262 RepID=A0A370GTA4_9NOCA|nr:hypothetical protein [Nocardia mexicana]RDI46721.1 hypothetical protein DFR68_110126 [Nocardia mexicana]